MNMKPTTPLIETPIRGPLQSPLAMAGLILVWFAITPSIQAVSPAPDGAYAGGNTAEGQNALFSLTTGVYNTAIGAGALFATIADENTATGAGALFSNTEGEANAAHGGFSLFHHTARRS